MPFTRIVFASKGALPVIITILLFVVMLFVLTVRDPESSAATVPRIDVLALAIQSFTACRFAGGMLMPLASMALCFASMYGWALAATIGPLASSLRPRRYARREWALL